MKKRSRIIVLIRQELFKLILLSFIINFLIEIMNRHSFMGCLSFIWYQFPIFIYNCLIIFQTFCIATLVRKHIFTTTFISILWILIGTVNGIVLYFRTTPFSAIDTLMLKNAMELVTIYFSLWQIIAIVIILFVAVLSLIILFIKAPKRKTKVNYISGILIFLISSAILAFSTNLGLQNGRLSNNFENLSYAYHNYGFAYCFTNSLIDAGIAKPPNYSKQTINQLKETITEDNKTALLLSDSKQPNIIFVQLESFFDVNHIKDISFSNNPVPEFTNLKKNYSTGFLTVPCVGAGTANTEFEVLTGMSTAFFGAGEYPYKTIMKNTVCESIAYQLKNQNYSTHAIHNNDGTFYNRNTVFGNLGFDTFTPVEYMYNIQQNPIGWIKDSILTGEIKKCMDNTKEKDFIFTVSVQGHGRYPSEYEHKHNDITIDGNDTKKQEMQYYINQLYEVDSVIGDIIKTLKNSNEPCIAVFYGDHLPTIGLTDKRIDNKNMYETEYVIWDNIGLKKSDKNLYSYQLTTQIFQLLGFEPGIMMKFHNKYNGKNSYHDNMKILEYDMLYGNHYIYKNQKNPYHIVECQMGINKIKISKIEKEHAEKKTYFIAGENFNQFSQIYINSKSKSTEFIDINTLKLTGVKLEKNDRVTVGQTGEAHVALGYSNEIIIP